MAKASKPADASTKSVKSFVWDTFFVAFAQLILKIRGFIVLPLFVKLLNTLSYGIWAQMNTWGMFIGSVMGLNLHLPLVRYMAEDRSKAREIYGSIFLETLMLSLVGCGILTLLTSPLSRLLLGDYGYEVYILYTSFWIVFSNLRIINLNVYRAMERLKTRALLDMTYTLLMTLGIILLLVGGLSLLAIFRFVVVFEGIFVVATSGHILSFLGIPQSVSLWWKKAMNYALPLVPSFLAIWSLSKVDRFFIGYYQGPQGVGIYSANYVLASLLLFLQMPFQITLFPKVSELWENYREQARQYLEQSLRVFLGLAFPFLFALPLVAKPALTFLGNQNIAKDSFFLAPCIGVGILFWGVSIIFSQIFHGAKATKALSLYSTIAALINLLLNAFLIPLYGLYGAAMATTLSYLLLVVLFYKATSLYLKLTIPWAFIFKSCMASLCMGGVVYFLPKEHMGALLLTCGVGFVAYFIFLPLFKGIQKEEWHWLMGMLFAKSLKDA